MNIDATFIAQDHLTYVTKALLSERHHTSREFFTLPCAFSWSDHLKVSRTPNELSEKLSCIREAYKSGKTQRVERRLEYANTITPDLIARTHTSRWWGQDNFPSAKYCTVSILVKEQGSWKVRISQFCDKMPVRPEAKVENRPGNFETDADAKEILQERLDRFADCAINRDAQHFLDLIDSILIVQKHGSSVILDTLEKKLTRFRDVTSFLDRLHVQQISRVVKTACFVADDLIVGTTKSYMVTVDNMLLPAYPSSVIVRRVDGHWKLLSVLNSLEVETQDAWPPR